MSKGVIGVAVHEQRPTDTLAVIRRADELGVRAAWLTTGGIGPDGLTIFAVAASQTQQIKLGTSIVPTFPRHPLVAVQQTLVIADLAPGRFRLGVGPSHKPAIEGTYRLSFERPLEEVREYVTILKQVLDTGQVDFDGKRLHAHGRTFLTPSKVPVFMSALRPGSYTLAGEISDGALSWISPAPFLRDVARPALLAGAARRTDGKTPILVGHAFAVVSTDEAEVKKVAHERLAMYARLPFYQEMFAAAGFPEARQGTLSDGMISSIVLHGDEDQVAAGIRRFVDAGLDELIVSLMPLDTDRRGTTERTLKLLARPDLV